MEKETVIIGPASWLGATGILFAVLECGTEQGKQEARAEFRNMARVADLVPSFIAACSSCVTLLTREATFGGPELTVLLGTMQTVLAQVSDDKVKAGRR